MDGEDEEFGARPDTTERLNLDSSKVSISNENNNTYIQIKDFSILFYSILIKYKKTDDLYLPKEFVYYKQNQ